MKFSLCIEPVFTKYDFYDRIRMARDCGADAVEFWDPSPYDIKRIGQVASGAGMPVAAMCLYNAWGARLDGPLERVLESLEKTIRAGKDIGCATFIALAGQTEGDAGSRKSGLIGNLKHAAGMCEKYGVTIVLEPLNSRYDHKGYSLDSSRAGFEVVRCVGSTRVKILFDCYHMQLMEGDLVNSIRGNTSHIGHFHSAGVPGRHELAQGEINYPFVIAAAEQAGYSGYFGLEYWPTYDDARSVRDVLEYVRG